MTRYADFNELEKLTKLTKTERGQNDLDCSNSMLSFWGWHGAYPCATPRG